MLLHLIKSKGGFTIIEALAAFLLTILFFSFISPIILHGTNSIERLYAQKQLRQFAEYYVLTFQKEMHLLSDEVIKKDENKPFIQIAHDTYGLDCSDIKCDILLANQNITKEEIEVIILPHSSFQVLNNGNYLLNLHLLHQNTKQTMSVTSLIESLQTTDPVVYPNELM